MKKFYVITNTTKDAKLHITKQVQELIVKNGGECKLEVDGDNVERDVDCILVLGGDGTMIRAAREYHKLGIPLLGVNIGTLGYLAEVELQGVDEAIAQMMKDNFVVEERMMLNGVVNDNEKDIALNDIVISRYGSLRIIRFNLYVNGQLLHSYKADGAIISTPTGSTAYNLSAGGPIVEPTAAMFVITPICSHALNTSSIVLSAEDEIVIEVGSGRDGSEEEVMLSFDGEHNIALRTGDTITVKKANDTVKFLKLSKRSFLETLRKKMEGK